MTAATTRRVSAASLQLNDRPHALYRFYDRTDVLLYVGITVDLPTRIKQHLSGKPWWSQVANMRVEHYPTRAEALEAERVAIETEGPLYNDQHNQIVEITETVDRTRKYAELIVAYIVDGPDQYERLLKLADERLEESEPDGDFEYQSSTELLAILMIQEVTDRLSDLTSEVRRLLKILPGKPFDYIKDSLPGECSDGDPESSVESVAVRSYADKLAEEFMVKLPESQRDEWIAWAVASTGSDGDAFFRGAIASMDYRESGTHNEDGRTCFGRGDHGARCPSLATVKYFMEGCECAPANERTCSGHLLTCDRHGIGLIARGFVISGDRQPQKIERFERIEAQQEVSPF